uniref:Protein kinase domain-containing protein n=1 Tax=Ditylenchus dipsaci TaxID=166011 RepID=A0A915EQT6_9BILA
MPYTEENVYRSVMEFVNGDTLDDFLKEKKPLTENLACLFLRQIAEGLHWLHKHNIIYGDLKPSNVIVEKNENFQFLKLTGKIKIIDFGLSTLGSDPEINANQKYSFFVDWWAFGILMYKMLYGDEDLEYSKENFSFQQKPSLEQEKIENEHKELTKIYKLKFPDKVISPDAKDLLSRLLNKDLNNRLGYGEVVHVYNEILQSDWLKKGNETFRKFFESPDKEFMTNFLKKELNISAEISEITEAHISRHKQTQSLSQSFRNALSGPLSAFSGPLSGLSGPLPGFNKKIKIRN